MKLHLQKDIIYCSLWMQGNATKAWQYNHNDCKQMQKQIMKWPCFCNTSIIREWKRNHKVVQRIISALSSQVMYHNNNHCQTQNEGVSFRERGWRHNSDNYAVVMESVPSESLMSLLKSTIENWFLGKKKVKNAVCSQQQANRGELVFTVVHLIDREPTCSEILQEE